MSKKQKLTPWFPDDVKPVRVGCYEVGYYSTHSRKVELYPFPFHWFDGEEWVADAWDSPTKVGPHGVRRSLSKAYGDGCYWRGLAKEPK